MQFLQIGIAYVAAPVIVVFIGGLFWRGATSAAAVCTLLVSPGVCLACQFGSSWISWWPTHVVYWLPLAVAILSALLVGISLFTKRKPAAELEGLIWSPHVATQDPDHRRGWRDYRLWAALAIVLMAVEIWWFR